MVIRRACSGCELLAIHGMVIGVASSGVCFRREWVVSANQFSGTLPSSIGNMTSLRYLYFSVNRLNGTIPPTIGALSLLLYVE